MVLNMVLPCPAASDYDVTYCLKQRSSAFSVKRLGCFQVDEARSASSSIRGTVPGAMKELGNVGKRPFVLTFHSGFGSVPSRITPDRQKSKVYRTRLSQLLSCMYAAFVMTLGLVVYVSDLLLPTAVVVQCFGLYLSVGSLLWLIFLHLDIRWDASRTKKEELLEELPGPYDSLESPQCPTADGGCSGEWLPARDAASEDFRRVTAQLLRRACARTSLRGTAGYRYLSGKHCGNFYLKIGAAGFCLGTLINEGLDLSRELMRLVRVRGAGACFSYWQLALSAVHPVTLFYELFVLFKYSNVVVSRHKTLARFGFMHCICSSLCFWFFTITKETTHSFYEKVRGGSIHQNHLMPGGLNGSLDLFLGAINGTVQGHFRCLGGSTELTTLISKASPYLYPFSVEFNFLIVTWFVMWQNIGRSEGCPLPARCPPDHHTCYQHQEAAAAAAERKRAAEGGIPFRGHDVVTVDCHAATRGLLAGFFVLVFTVVSLIIFFVAESDRAYVDLGVLLSHVTQAALLSLMSAAAVGAYHQLVKLDVSRRSVSVLDDLLLFVSVPAFFFYGIFSIVAGVAYRSFFSVAVAALNVLQVLIQTPLVVEGLRRVSNSPTLQRTKPGRGLVTFLIICNLAIWILDTFGLKSTDDHTAKTLFYGDFLWTVFGHLTLPLCLFYRFHSTVCLADIWKCAYEPEGS